MATGEVERRKLKIALWDRREPLRSAALLLLIAIVALEAFLVMGGRWMLVGQREWQGDDAIYGEISVPASRSWRNLSCTYWTGRSVQTIEIDGQFTPAPRECPFITRAI